MACVPVVVRRILVDEAERLRCVRLAALSDSPAAFASTYAREEQLTDDDWAERARSGASGPGRATFLALDGDDVVGLVGGYRADETEPGVELVSMWTAPSARRSGVGRLLVGAVVDWARSVGAAQVDLWVVRGNGSAEGFYRAMGFADTGHFQPLPSDPCRDELRMTLVL